MPLEEDRFSVRVDRKRCPAHDIRLPASKDMYPFETDVTALKGSGKEGQRLQLGHVGNHDDIEKAVRGVGIRAEFEASSFVTRVHGNGKIDGFKFHLPAVIKRDGHFTRFQVHHQTQCDSDIRQLAEPYLVQQDFQAGDHDLMADARIEADTGAYRETPPLTLIGHGSYINICIFGRRQNMPECRQGIRRQSEAAGEVIARADGDIAECHLAQICDTIHDLIDGAVAAEHDKRTWPPVAGKLSGDTGGMTLVSCQICLIICAAFL